MTISRRWALAAACLLTAVAHAKKRPPPKSAAPDVIAPPAEPSHAVPTDGFVGSEWNKEKPLAPASEEAASDEVAKPKPPAIAQIIDPALQRAYEVRFQALSTKPRTKQVFRDGNPVPTEERIGATQEWLREVNKAIAENLDAPAGVRIDTDQIVRARAEVFVKRFAKTEEGTRQLRKEWVELQSFVTAAEARLAAAQKTENVDPIQVRDAQWEIKQVRALLGQLRSESQSDARRDHR